MGRLIAGFAFSAMLAACGSTDEGGAAARGSATATIGSQTFAISNVQLTFQPGDGGFFRIEGDDAAHAETDCLPGLAGGLALYGDVPSDATSIADLKGKELPFEFTGDGDEANLCFVGSNGLLGVETGTVTFTAVEGNKVTFNFSGSFKVYDGEGGESATPVSAHGNGTAYHQ
jgi:hypothetical protein